MSRLVHVGSWRAGLSAVVLILLAVCSSCGSAPATSTSAASATATASGGSASTPLTPQQALIGSATQSKKITSATETISIQDNGTQNVTTTGTVQYRRTPTFAVAEDVTVTTAGQSTQLKAIITDTAFYINEPSLASQVGKPWIKIDLSTLQQTPALASIADLVQSMQSNTFVDMTGLFAATSDARTVGTATVDGVPTTEYAGSFQGDVIAKALAPGLRKAMASELKALGNSTVEFHIWIDAQGHARKMIEVETLNGMIVTTNVTIAGINQPIQISLPPASQTYTQPAS